jgi:hypothetical protein
MRKKAMPRLRQAVAQQVADQLFAVENAIDAALTQAAELTAVLPKARAEARLSAIVGQAALDQTAAALAALVEARRCIVDAHEQLDTVRGQIGLREVDFGDLAPKPSLATGDARHLRSVA